MSLSTPRKKYARGGIDLPEVLSCKAPAGFRSAIEELARREFSSATETMRRLILAGLRAQGIDPQEQVR